MITLYEIGREEKVSESTNKEIIVPASNRRYIKANNLKQGIIIGGVEKYTNSRLIGNCICNKNSIFDDFFKKMV